MKQNLLLLFIAINTTAFLQAQHTTLATRTLAFQQLFQESTNPQLSYVNDFEDIFTTEQSRHLDSLLSHFQQKDSFKITLVTVDTTFVVRAEFDSVAYLLSRKWGIGQAKESNSVIIIVSRGYSRIRIYNGYDISAILSYNDTKLLIDLDFIPFYKKKEYYEGTVNGVAELMKMLMRAK